MHKSLAVAWKSGNWRLWWMEMCGDMTDESTVVVESLIWRVHHWLIYCLCYQRQPTTKFWQWQKRNQRMAWDDVKLKRTAPTKIKAEAKHNYKHANEQTIIHILSLWTMFQLTQPPLSAQAQMSPTDDLSRSFFSHRSRGSPSYNLTPCCRFPSRFYWDHLFQCDKS